MDMEVMIPSPVMDFNFNSVCATPYISAPSSPQRCGTFFVSAPTSPTRATAFYNEFNDFRRGGGGGGGGGGEYGTSTASDYGSASVVPFNLEEKPGVPKSKEEEDEKDFAFDFSGHLETSSLSAEELFDGGKIKPLKPPPRLQLHVDSSSPKSLRSPKNMIKEALSPRHRKKDFDPFAAGIEHTLRECTIERKIQMINNAVEKGITIHQLLGKKGPDHCPHSGCLTCYWSLKIIKRMQRLNILCHRLCFSLRLLHRFGTENGS